MPCQNDKTQNIQDILNNMRILAALSKQLNIHDKPELDS
uniref:Uncharacterized protein n=1 Tax=Arundo donax TaxID=35708 RepID=A0A0A9A426_ARUDO